METHGNVLDRRVLDELRSALGASGNAAFKRVVETYLTHTPPLVEALKTALVGPVWEELARAAHTLRSSSAALGASSLAQAAKTLEQAAGQRDAAVGAHVALVEELAGEVQVALRSELGGSARP
jgi:HPt (histidine-containing phosphotransfer) domain-containing protein